MSVTASASASFVDCDFVANYLYVDVWGSAVIEAGSWGPFDQGHDNTEVRLEDCTFQGNTGDQEEVHTLLVDQRAGTTNVPVFYSDSPAPEICVFQGPVFNSKPPACQLGTAKALDDAQDVVASDTAWDPGFLSASDPWLKQAEEVSSDLEDTVPASWSRAA